MSTKSLILVLAAVLSSGLAAGPAKPDAGEELLRAVLLEVAVPLPGEKAEAEKAMPTFSKEDVKKYGGGQPRPP